MSKNSYLPLIILAFWAFILVSCISPGGVVNLPTVPPKPSLVAHTSTIEQMAVTAAVTKTSIPSLALTPSIASPTITETAPTPTETDQEPGWIAFTWTSEDGSESEIYKIRTDGSGLVNLTRSPGFDDHPSWSPDGTQIAFSSHREGSMQLYLMDEDGNHQRRISDIAPIYTSASWSPDGKKIAFASDGIGDNSDIYILDLTTSVVENVTNSPYLETGPEWSPDGQKIMWGACSDENLEDEFVDKCFLDILNLETKNTVRLMNTSDFYGASDWSPDSSKIASECNLNLCIINLDDSGRVEFDRLEPGKEYYMIGVSDPSWSPDGSRIVFRSLKDLDEALYIADVSLSEGISNVFRLTPPTLEGGVETPDWGP